MVFAVGNDTALNCADQILIGIGMIWTYKGKTATLMIGSADENSLPIFIIIHNRLEILNSLMVLQNVVKMANQVVALCEVLVR